MLRRLLILIGLIGAAAVQAAPPPMTDLVAVFDRFAARTAALPGPARAAMFRSEFGPTLPGVYPHKSTDLDGKIAATLSTWPQQREATLAARDRITLAYGRGTARFAKAFPGYRPIMPAYVIHAFGEMDGGTRNLEGKTVLIFGADVIARLHTRESIEPLVDHELFHTYHARFFPADCEAVWCQLWTEGLATYVSARMNPRATDSELLLTYPKPIRAPIDARFGEALCATRANLDAKDEKTTSRFFSGSDRTGPFPARFGYYVGMRIVERIGRGMTLDQLARMPAGDVRRRIDAVIDTMARCLA